MANYEETLMTLEEMRSRYHTGFSSSDKGIIERLYLQVCGKRVRNTGCKDCWRDAYIETYTKLKKTGTMKKPNYTLKAGAIVHPQGTSNFYALNNIPDEVAENWLGQFPNEIFKFETYPADWESRVKARKEGTVVEPTIDELKAKVEALEAANEAKDVEIEALKANGSTDDGAAAMEIETLKADLATANENVEKAKAEGQAEVEALNKTIDELKAKVEALEAELDAAKKKTTKKAAAAE
jgi:cob(I)alamin adenosyltransferase